MRQRKPTDVRAYPRRSGPHRPDRRPRLLTNHIERWVTIATLLCLVLLASWILTTSNWDLRSSNPSSGWAGDFYTAQASALLHGHFDVPRGELPGECFNIGTECYGYFGLFPSIVRIPLLWAQDLPGGSWTPLFTLFAIAIAGFFALKLIWRAPWASRPLPLVALWVIVPAGIASTVGSVLLLAARPTVYHEGIAWAIAATLAFLYFVVRWIHDRRTALLIGACIAGCAAGLSRPGGIFPPLVIAIGLALHATLTHSWHRKLAAALLALGLLPLMSNVAVSLAKFGAIRPDFANHEQFQAAPWWLEILAINGNRANGGIAFAPTNLVSLLRPDNLTLNPFGGGVAPRGGAFSFVWPIADGGTYVESYANIWILMPVAIAGIIGAIIFRRRLRGQRTMGLAMVAAMTAIVPVALNLGVTARYIADLAPAGVVAISAGTAAILALKGRMRVAASAVILLLVSMQTYACISLALNLAGGG